MRTNIVLNDELVAQASELTGISTKRKLIDEALRTLIQVRRRKPLLEISGKISFSKYYDYKALRR